uniref:Uncharacterized protein n=1 Tax=Timema genevievae TaxID=629358 RepID=A0A7R9PML5_TIMGE|nr:unnamed protein product [Timema genevievae]
MLLLAATVAMHVAMENKVQRTAPLRTKPQRRGSMGSLDSGMSVSFQSMSPSSTTHEPSQITMQPSSSKGSKGMVHQQSFLGVLFAKRERKSSRAEDIAHLSRSTEV